MTWRVRLNPSRPRAWAPGAPAGPGAGPVPAPGPASATGRATAAHRIDRGGDEQDRSGDDLDDLVGQVRVQLDAVGDGGDHGSTDQGVPRTTAPTEQ